MTELNDTAKLIHGMKYAKDGEDWLHTCFRVSEYLASPHVDEENYTDILTNYFNLMYDLIFIPGGRVLANAGTNIKNLNNCFVLPIEDSRQSIYETLKNAAEIFAWGGGLGFNFSKVRETGAPIKTTGGTASGPLSFMTLYDQTGEVIQQASRRGAQMGMLNIDHPDIEDFIHFKSRLNHRNTRLMEEYKRNLETKGLDKKGTKYFEILDKTLTDDQLTHFNISVVITDEFMEAVELDRDWNLTSRVDGSIVKTLKARDLLRQIATQSWKSGDPGVFFFDRTNKDNLVSYLGDLEVTNPCVTGDTLILTVYDGAIPIKTLAEKGEDTLVYGWNQETKEPAVGLMYNIHKTKSGAEVLEVEFDSGLKVKCTPEHSFFTMRGEKIPAKHLTKGMSVRAFSGGIHPTDKHTRIHAWKEGGAKHHYTARLVWEYFNEQKIPHGMVIHHKNHIESDNHIENLLMVDKSTHSSYHYKDRNRYFRGRNHKVVALRSGGFEDVYNGTVDGCHTYIIADPKPISGDFSGIVSANCGEVPLLPYEPCCLGSINLHKILKEDKTIDFEFLEFVVRNAVNMLDDVQTLSETPVADVNYWSKRLRRLGIGVMGWADMLAEMGIPYDSDTATMLALSLSWFINYFAHLESMALANKKGKIDIDWEKANIDYLKRLLNSKEFSPRKFTEDEIRETGLRNVATTSIAPTGTIALIAGVNSSIEPFFALAYKRHITEGVGNTAKQTVVEINPILFRKLKELGFDDKQLERVAKHVLKTGTIQDFEEIPEIVRAAFRTSQEIEPIWHIEHQAAWQEFTDNAISKTINLPEQSTVEDIEDVIKKMWALGLKGGTIYRDGSKIFQILNKGTKE